MDNIPLAQNATKPIGYEEQRQNPFMSYHICCFLDLSIL